ncbi:Tim44 domain-containing protein [Roseateles toxinivorans]|uniref:Putative lipid-binding transport protein (Tim44 family) n=1 Tax=Roseateles toxinivorans TaxID=270368 RepID=A0A4R6QKF7_9BURK|nr:Tim44-like domain-containing protein [Roseateles toxinivorans]TDP63787.1 putative lipid-binding transport protein (Tim44 family) [Roseateles toxinivorans]
MKHLLLSVCIALSGLVIVQSDAEARRLGGGSSAGMKRTTPAATPDATPAKPAQAAPAQAQAAAPTAAAATPPKRSWMGPLAGLAAGLGLAALASHLGFGEGLANIMSILLVVMLGAVLLGFVMKYLRNKRNAPAAQGLHGMQFANAGFGSAQVPQSFGSGAVTSQTKPDLIPSIAATAAPIGFDNAEFETIAKRVFIRLQAANDAGDLDDLRRFTTPEMFAVARQELLERPGTPQQTDVVQLQAAVAEHAEEDGRQIVSVRFSGLIREVKDAPAEAFNEIWHLVRPLDGSREWAIAGIQQAA